MDDRLTKVMDDIDAIYERVLNDDSDIFNDLDKVLEGLANIDDIVLIGHEDLLNEISTKLNCINNLLNLDKEELAIEELRKEFESIEKDRFNIVNKYIMGIVCITDIDRFKEKLFTFRKKLYAISISDSNILEVAKMKSKVQHFRTEVLEDEEVLKVAYSNTF